jgi:hypothetical protein
MRLSTNPPRYPAAEHCPQGDADGGREHADDQGDPGAIEHPDEQVAPV